MHLSVARILLMDLAAIHASSRLIALRLLGRHYLGVSVPPTTFFDWCGNGIRVLRNTCSKKGYREKIISMRYGLVCPVLYNPSRCVNTCGQQDSPVALNSTIFPLNTVWTAQFIRAIISRILFRDILGASCCRCCT